MADKKYAVLIGCNNYPGDPQKLPSLRCAENDATRFRELLLDPDIGGFEVDNVLLFTNEPSSDILVGLATTLQNADKGDLVVVYFSGHGRLDVNSKLHLATSNTDTNILGVTSIPISVMNDQLEKSPSDKIVLILDSCYSGAVESGFKGGDAESELQISSGGSGRYIMTASTAIQVAEEKEGEEYSLFTKYLLEGLQTGDADSAGDGTITVDELFNYARDEVVQKGRQQPMKFAFGVKEDLVIAVVRQPRRLRQKIVTDLFREGELTVGEFNFAIDIVSSANPLTVSEEQLIELLDAVLRGADPTGCVVYIRTLFINSIEKTKAKIKKRADDFRHKEMYQEALNEWNKILELDPSDAEALSEIEELTGIIRTHESMKEYANLAMKSFEEGSYLDAMVKWIEVLKLDEENERAIDGIYSNLSKFRELVGVPLDNSSPLRF